LLEDRLGVYITAEHPNDWHVGASESAGAAFPAGVVKLVKGYSRPTPTTPTPALRLTVVIRGDRRLRGTASPESSGIPSVIPHPVVRTLDASDRYKKQTLARHSEFNNTAAPVVRRNDQAEATVEAASIQRMTANGVLAGKVTIPWLERSYEVGERISDVDGRGLTFDTSGGAPSPVYPVIIARHHQLDGERRTVLDFTDANSARHVYRRKLTRRSDPRNT
jgi:hypothetical protein